jgi:RNA polymerase sigma factor (sigma-70 family)
MDDLEFVQKCVAGDRQVWDKFVERYSRLIYSYIHTILGAQGYALAQNHVQDIFQDFFCFLIKDNFSKLRTFRGKNGCSLASWLRQVTVNFTIDYLRKLKPALSLDAQNGEELSLKDILASESELAPDALTNEERISSLKECIEALTSEDKYFLELHINRGFRPEELKKILKLSRGAVDMKKLRIIDRLRDCFKHKGFVLEI